MAARRRTTPDPFSDRFHLLLGRLVHAHASFDFNMGLQLRWLGEYNGVPVGHLLDVRVPFGHRLKALRPLALHTFEPAGDKAVQELGRLFDQADGLKALRNDYVHGRWGVPGRMVGGEPRISFVRLNWNMEPDRPDESVVLTLAQFEEQVREVEALARDYYQLTKKYERFARPPKAVSSRVVAAQ
jgi:hypothetical protein